MTSVWDELAGILEEQLSVQHALLELGARKAELVAGAQVRDLELLLYTEEALLAQSQRLEDARLQLQEGLDVGDDRSTLRRLAAQASPPARDRLEILARELGLAVARLSDQTRANRELLQQALAIVNYQLSLLSGSGWRPQLDCRT
ncbi:MAG TPA: hypothetical protein DCM14_09135 [Clostridiales bacterium UBA8153]|nr:hypothetical protein [Clostridiales bacterium UBA8153]